MIDGDGVTHRRAHRAVKNTRSCLQEKRTCVKWLTPFQAYRVMQVEIRAYGSNATEFVVSTSSERSIQILRYFCELRNFMIVMSVGFAAAIWCSTFNMALKWIWSVLVMVCFVYVASFGFFRLMDWNVQKGRTYLMN